MNTSRRRPSARAITAILTLVLTFTACDRPLPADASKAASSQPRPDAGASAPAIDPAAATSRAPAPDALIAAPIYRELRDFTVACDNGGRCSVIGVVDAAPGIVLRLQRDAGPDGAQSLALSASDASLDARALRLDGVAVPAISALPWRRDGDDTLRLDAGADIARFIDLARNGKRLSVGEGDDALAVSLSGFAAALLLVDERQRRLDTQGAWARRGARADAGVPAAPRLPTLPPPPAEPPALPDADAKRLVAAVRRAQAPALRAEDCETERSDGDDSGFDITRDDAAEPLDAAHALVFVTCLSGAYQSSSLVFIAPRAGGAATRVSLPAPPFDTGGEPREAFAMVTNVDYDPATGTLSHVGKGRGLADCGESATWRYDGRTFRLQAFAQLQRCGGDPGDWPALWRTAGGSDGT